VHGVNNLGRELGSCIGCDSMRTSHLESWSMESWTLDIGDLTKAKRSAVHQGGDINT